MASHTPLTPNPTAHDRPSTQFEQTIRLRHNKSSDALFTHEPPLTNVGDYRVIREIGRGGMGVVYEAEQKSLRRRVALKILPFSITHNQQSLDRFRREARSAARLHHTNIVPVFEVGRDGDICYYAMQYIDGRGLNEMTLRQSGAGPRDYGFVARLGEQVARGLDYAHKLGVVHRDIKPSNIILDANATVWISDFGLAKAAGESVTNSGELIGTLHYMAPERFRGQCDERADIYALGISLYEILLGRPAYQTTDHIEIIDQIQNANPTRPRSVDTNVPRDLEVIILKAIEKDPKQRYQSAADLAEDLRRFQADEPIAARPIGPLHKVVRAAKRNPRMALLIALVVLLALTLVGGAVTAAVFFRHMAKQEHLQAEVARFAERRATKAREKAEVETKRANEQTEMAKEISTFLLGLIEDSDPLARPGQGLGMRKLGDKRLTPLELLDHCEKKLKTSLLEKPAVRAALLDRIGTIYVGYGIVSRARPLLQEALTLRKKIYAGDHPELAESWQNLGYFYHIQRKPRAALASYRKAVEMRIRLFGDDHPLVAESLVHIGFLKGGDVNDAQVEGQIRRAMDIQAKHSGKKSREYGVAGMAMLQLRIKRLQFDKAIVLLAELESVMKSQTDNKDLVITVHAYLKGQLAHKLGMHAQAVKEYRRGLEFGESLLGETHYLTRQLHFWIAMANYNHLNDLPAAEQTLRMLIDRLKKINADATLFGAEYYMHLGRVLRNQKKYAEAAEVLRESVAIMRNEGGDLGRCLHILGEVLYRDGKSREAESILADAVAARHQQFQTMIEAQETATNLSWYGKALDFYLILLLHNKKTDFARTTLEFHLPNLDKYAKPSADFHYRQAKRRSRLCALLVSDVESKNKIDAVREKAMASLKNAIKAGYKFNTRYLQKSTTFQELRRHPDFAKVITPLVQNTAK